MLYKDADGEDLWMNIELWWRDELGRHKSTQKTLPQCHIVHCESPTRTDLELNRASEVRGYSQHDPELL